MHYRPQDGANVAIGITLDSGLQIGGQSIKFGLVLGKVFSVPRIFGCRIRQASYRPLTVNRSGPSPRFSSGRNGIGMLTVSSPFMGKKLTKFAYLLMITRCVFLPLSVGASGREGAAHAPANTGNGSAMILQPRYLA
jgi:hypothetical protein